MRRRSFLVSVPPVVLAAAGAFGAGRVSTSGPPDAPPCGSGGAGGRGSQPPPPDPTDPTDPPVPPGPGAAPGLVPPLPTPTESERAWLQEWLDLVARPSGTAASGC